jgi:serine/threonine protein phosphatase PrpC
VRLSHKSKGQVAPTLRERSSLAKQLRLDVAQLTDVGRKREHNEDNMAYVIPKDPQVMARKGALFIVADGMGGHAAGEVASEIAVDTVSNAYYQDDSDDVADSLLHAIRRANASIHQRAAENMLRSGMGTTCVAAVLRGNRAYIANVGDSRAYLMRGIQVKQISQDHSWVAEQVRAGLLTEDQARTHAQRNVITRSLGTQAEVDIDVFKEELSEGNYLVLCTDGLSGLVSEEELQRIVDQYVPQESVYRLVERANENGGPDNITAIVVRIQEVGEEPPGVRHPVRVGGREAGENTALLGVLPDTSIGIPQRNGEGRSPSAPLRFSSGPLAPTHDGITAPQPALGRSRRRRSRLFYPTLTLLALLILAGVGAGAFFLLRVNESQTVSQTLRSTQLRIDSAQVDISNNNPASALNALATAQNSLRDVQKNHQLDKSQQQQLTQLKVELVTQVKAAIVNYNQGAHISVLPCATTSINPIDNTSTHTYPQNIAWAQDPKGAPVLYALAQDFGLYQVNNQYSLVARIASNATSHILNVSSDSSHVFVLVEQLKNGVPTGYTLDVYQPGQEGVLGKSTFSAQIGTDFTRGGFSPAFVTTWDNNVYVVLNSNQNNARVLSYVIDAKGHLSTPKPINFSISAAIVSATAFSQQLFLLLSDGEVRSLSLAAGSQTILPTAVFVQQQIALPLAAGSKNFTANEAVPTVTPVGQKGNASLVVSSPSSVASNTPSTNTAMLSTGVINGTPHLYIGDPVNHRVLDLDVAKPLVGGPPTPTPRPTGTNVAGNNVTLGLVQQYVLSSGSSLLKSLAVNPEGKQLDILSQNAPSASSLISVGTGPQSGC